MQQALTCQTYGAGGIVPDSEKCPQKNQLISRRSYFAIKTCHLPSICSHCVLDTACHSQSSLFFNLSSVDSILISKLVVNLDPTVCIYVYMHVHACMCVLVRVCVHACMCACKRCLKWAYNVGQRYFFCLTSSRQSQKNSTNSKNFEDGFKVRLTVIRDSHFSKVQNQDFCCCSSPNEST